eukprot:Clim_evm34s153 gene=Clim_evmTU34s153
MSFFGPWSNSEDEEHNQERVNMTAAPAVRVGDANDLPDVLRLVKELAEFEKQPDAVAVTLEDMKKHYNDGRFQLFIAENGAGSVIGMALYFERYSTWQGPYIHLEDLYVSPDSRGQGIGRMLLEAVIRESQNRGQLRLGWEVLDWNTKAQDVYKGMGAIIQPEWWQCRMYKDTLDGFEHRHPEPKSKQ